MKKTLALMLSGFLLASPVASFAAPAQTPTQKIISKMEWRNIGPFIGGRVVAVAGVPSNPNLFYMGGVQGGVWRSTDYGLNWENISDGKIAGVGSPIGALDVSLSNPRVIYAGTGESDLRGDFDTGDGIYKSTNAGKTWEYAGLRETHTTSAIAIHPTDSNIVYAGSMGHVFKPNPERGVFKTTDGGKTWNKVLFVDDSTGAINVVMDPTNPRVVYASMWQMQRVPWKLTSGGPGSGLYKTTDGGAHWTNIAKNPGFAAGPLGRIGVAVAPSNPRVLYAIVQAHEGGVFRSTDGGASWKRMNSQMKLRQRAFYYMNIYADPKNSKVAYAPQVEGLLKSTDAGVTWKALRPPHGDNHIVWVNPHHPEILLEGNDGGATVSTDGGKTWSSERNQPTGQYYHVALDDQFPYHVYGAAQDEGAFEIPSASPNGFIGEGDLMGVASGESTFVAPLPGNPNVTFGGAYNSALFRLDNSTGEGRNVSPWPNYYSGASSAENKYRFGWTHPVMFSPANSKELLVTAQVVFSSLDQGQTWKVLSGDLTRNDKSTQGPTGGPIDLDATGVETFPDIASLAVSPINGDVMWAGSADGLVHVTTNHGVSWSAVTPPELPQWTQISSIEASHVAPGTAYLSANRYMWDDFHPYVYKTTDYGAHWTSMNAGIPEDQYVFAVRQDPREPRVLFAGTRSTAYVSLDGGAQWQPLTLNLPGVQVHDLAVDARQGQVVAATHGRAFWVLDNLALLEQLARDGTPSIADAQLFHPETAWLTHAYGSSPFPIPNVGKNPAYGATVFFSIPASYDGKTPVKISFADAHGTTVRSFDLHLKDKKAKKMAPEVRAELDAVHARALDLTESTAIEPGMNAFNWDMRYWPATEVPGARDLVTDDFSDTVDGPTIVPGAYTATLQYGQKKMSVPLKMSLDPRFHTSSEDLAARLALEMRINKTMDTLDKTIIAAMSAANHAPAAKRAQIYHVIGDLVQLNIHSNEGDLLHESKLREHLGFLAAELEDAYARPTPAEYQTFSEYQTLAAQGEARLHSLM